MHAGVKVIFGLVLILIGLGLFVDSAYPFIKPLLGDSGKLFDMSTNNIDVIKSFVIVVAGVVPISLILLGILIFWLEMDELKAQKELKK